MGDILRWNKDFAMEQAADDEDLLRELLEIFKVSCTKEVAAIEQAISDCDAHVACNSAHSIKGAAASLGMEGFREIAYEIENDSRSGSLARAEEYIADLKNMLLHLKQVENLI